MYSPLGDENVDKMSEEGLTKELTNVFPARGRKLFYNEFSLRFF